MRKCTPAPWAVYLPGEMLREDGVIVETGNGYEVRPAAGQKLGDELADLALVAAAPKLLTALRKLIAWHDADHNDSRAAIDDARAAIKEFESTQ